MRKTKERKKKEEKKEKKNQPCKGEGGSSGRPQRQACVLCLLLALVGLPLRLGHLHQQVLILDGDPRGQRLHGVLKVRIQEHLAKSLHQRGTGSVQDIQSAWRGRSLILVRRGWRRLKGISQQEKDVPDAQLCRKGNREVEQRQVPSGSVGRRVNAQVGLRRRSRQWPASNICVTTRWNLQASPTWPCSATSSQTRAAQS